MERMKTSIKIDYYIYIYTVILLNLYLFLCSIYHAFANEYGKTSDRD